MQKVTQLTAIGLLVIGLLSACVTPTYVKTYTGPELPRDQVALLKPTVGVQVVAINGDRSFGVKTAQAVGYLETEMALRPGDYKIEVMLNHGDVWSKGTTLLNLSVIAGRKYLINYSMLPAQRSWSPRIEDVTERPDRWCALASSVNFKGCKSN